LWFTLGQTLIAGGRAVLFVYGWRDCAGDRLIALPRQSVWIKRSYKCRGRGLFLLPSVAWQFATLRLAVAKVQMAYTYLTPKLGGEYLWEIAIRQWRARGRLILGGRGADDRSPVSCCCVTNTKTGLITSREPILTYPAFKHHIKFMKGLF